MLSQSVRPRAAMAGTESRVGVRVGRVESCEVMDSGRAERKAFRVFIVLGTPLKEMHFSPTSRMNSAVWRELSWERERVVWA